MMKIRQPNTHTHTHTHQKKLTRAFDNQEVEDDTILKQDRGK